MVVAVAVVAGISKHFRLIVLFYEHFSKSFSFKPMMNQKRHQAALDLPMGRLETTIQSGKIQGGQNLRREKTGE